MLGEKCRGRGKGGEVGPWRGGGKWGKGSTMDKASEAAKKKLTKTFKVKGGCKVVEIEEPVKIYRYSHYMDDVNAKKGKKLSFIQAYVKISGGKITRIAFSA